MKTPLNKATLKQHLAYSWWKYIVLVLVSIIGWNLIYTTTAYRPPEDKKINMYVGTGYVDQALLDAYMENIRLTEMSDMEEMNSSLLTNDEYYGSIQLSTYIMAGEGDVYLLNKENFQSYAAAGAFVELEDQPELMAALGDRDLKRGWRTNTDEGTRHLYGIPADSLTGLTELGIPVADGYLVATAGGGNVDNSVKFMTILVRDMSAASAVTTPTDLATATTLP